MTFKREHRPSVTARLDRTRAQEAARYVKPLSRLPLWQRLEPLPAVMALSLVIGAIALAVTAWGAR
jgi:hypothetical protein